MSRLQCICLELQNKMVMPRLKIIQIGVPHKLIVEMSRLKSTLLKLQNKVMMSRWVDYSVYVWDYKIKWWCLDVQIKELTDRIT